MKKKLVPKKNFPWSVIQEVGPNANYDDKVKEWKKQRNRRKRGISNG